MKQNDGAERKMKQRKKGKRRGLLIFTLIGLILILLFTGLIIHMFRARQAEKAEMEEVEAAELEVEYSGQTSDFVVDDDGDAVQYFYLDRTAENATLFDSFTTEVILPTA